MLYIKLDPPIAVASYLSAMISHNFRCQLGVIPNSTCKYQRYLYQEEGFLHTKHVRYSTICFM